MSITQNLGRLILAASLSLPLAALADNGGGPGPEHGDGPGHMQGMHGCGMAMGHEHGPMMGHDEMFGDDGEVPHALRHLQLSEAQQDKIFAIMHGQAPQARELRKAMHKAHSALHELVTTGPYDDAKAKALSDSLGKALSESALLHARTHHQILDVLTPEQRQELAHHGEHDGEHGPGHHGDHGAMSP
jgi:Spy/CpxP family protein refolding chaperone